MRRFAFTLLLFFGSVWGAQAGLIVTTTNDGTTLANTVLGSGVTISNIQYNGAAGASGTFTGGVSAGIGIESGIILTTGDAANAVGPNNSNSRTTDNGLSGDPQLSALVGATTFDATSLQFDFVSNGGDLFFNYVFASEEYNEFVNLGVNDVFAFFVDGVNVALIPGTSTPVSIDNVNNGTNSSFYVDNSPPGTPPPFDIQYDGFTKVLRVEVLNLSAGTHTLKLAIADVGDRQYDSAVFIQAGTVSDTMTGTVPEPASILCGSLGVLAMGFGARKRWSKSA